MNKKLSGAKSVVVEIAHLGKTYLPYFEDLRNRYIKYIDVTMATHLPGTTTEGVTSLDGMFITLTDRVGNQHLMENLPLGRLNYQETYGLRQQIGSEISMQNSYIEVSDADQVGKAVLLTFWYDLPEYSQRNITDATRLDGVTIPIKSAIYPNTLPDVMAMAGKRFRSVLFQLPGIAPDYSECVDETMAKSLYLTLRKGSYTILEDVPLMLLWQMVQADKIEFANIIFDFQSSYITVGGAGSYTDPVGKSVFLNMVYEK